MHTMSMLRALGNIFRAKANPIHVPQHPIDQRPDPAPAPTPLLHYCRVEPYHENNTRQYFDPNSQWRAIGRRDHKDKRALFIAFGATADDAMHNLHAYMQSIPQ